MTSRGCALSLLAFLAACPGEPVGGADAGAPPGADAASAGPDASPDCGWGLTALGECAPETPRGTPEAECPSGRTLGDAGFSGRGLCLPDMPRGTPEAECPSGQWSDPEGFADRGICLPAPPLVRDWTCPAGWASVPFFPGDAGTQPGLPATSYCQPAMPTACPDGERFALETGACRRVGDACPAGDWPDDAELRARAPGFTGTLRFVKPGAASPADGTRAAPYAALSDALAAAGALDVIALAAGDHPGRSFVNAAVAVVGACATATRFTGTASPSLSIGGAGRVLVADVAFTGGGGLEVRDRASATTVRGVRVLSAAGSAVEVTGGTDVATLEDVHVLGFSAVGQAAATAAVVVAKARAVIAGATLESIAGASLRVTGVATALPNLHATDLVVRDLLPRALDGDARGLFVGDGAKATLVRAAFKDGVGQAVQVAQSGSLDASDLWISGMRSRADGMLGNGLEVDAAGVASLSQTVVSDVREAALVAFDPGSRLSLADVLVRDVEPAGDGSYGMGVWLDDSATLDALRLVVERPTVAGVGLGRSTVSLTDFVVKDCRPAANLTNGRGVSMEAGASVKLTRGVVQGVADVAVMVHGTADPTTLELTDLAIRDVAKVRAAGQLGTGLVASVSSAVTGRRLLVERATTSAMRTSGSPASVALTDVVLRDTQPDSSGSFGRGVDAQFGGQATLSRLLVSKSRDVAVAGDALGTRVTLADAVVLDTEPQQKSGDFGVAVSAQNKAVASLQRVAVSRAAFGLQANGAALMAAIDVSISDTSREGFGLFGGTFVDARRLLLERVGGTAVLAYEGGLQAADVVVRDVRSASGGTYGWGLQLAEAPSTIDRLLVERAFDLGLIASGATSAVTARDVLVRDLESEVASGRGGFGLVSQAGAALALERVRVERARNVALLALAGGKVVATTVSLLDTRDAVCGESCKGGGTGAAVFHAGSGMELTDFVIEKSPLIGLQLGAGALLHARRGLLARNLVAMNVLEPGFDFSTGLESVKVFENGVDLASEVVPVPTVGPLQHPPDAGN